MSANGISTLSTKALRQVAKLNYAQRKRQGYQVSGTNGSVSFNGTSQYLTVPDAVPLRLYQATAWTIECWIYYTGSGSGSILEKDGVQGNNNPTYELHIASGYARGTVADASTQQAIQSNTLLPTNAWTHLAFVLNSGTYTLYQNGVSVATAAVVTSVGNFATSALYIAYQDSGTSGAYFRGSISNVRIVKGTALYTGAFTPPSGRLPIVTNTSLLLNTVYGFNFLVDSSNNAYTVTNNGTATSLSASPTTTNTVNTSANFYRARNTYDITQLPTQYNGNGITDNANASGLIVSRPWAPGVSAGLQVFLQTAPSTGATWTDASGNGNNATIVTTGSGTYTYASDHGGGITLAGDYGAGLNISGYNLPTDGGTYSVEVVASVSSTNYWSSIFGNDDFTLNKGVVAYYGNSSNFYISTPTSNGVYAPVSVATRQNINQYIITVTGNTVKFYLNGVSQALTNNTGGSPGFTASSGTPTNGLMIGARHPNAGTAGVPYDSAGGTYYLVRVYNTVLSQTDVTTNYNAVKSTYGI